MKNFSTVVGVVLLTAFLVGCQGGPTVPEVKPKAVVSISLSPEPVTFTKDFWTGAWSSAFNIILAESNGVSATVTTVKVEFLNGAISVMTYTGTGGTVPARGSVSVPCSLVVPSDFTIMKIVVQGQDANGYPVNETKSWSFTFLAGIKTAVR